MTTIPTLELRGIDKSFGPVHVLSSVNFTANAGEVTALVGDNGAGKTTLVKCIGGIHRVDAGELIFDGTPRSINGPRTPRCSGSRSSTRISRWPTTSTSSTTCFSGARRGQPAAHAR